MEGVLFISPEKYATEQNITPTAENGITTQFNAPKHGINATSIPVNEIIPQIKLNTCIIHHLTVIFNCGKNRFKFQNKKYFVHH